MSDFLIISFQLRSILFDKHLPHIGYDDPQTDLEVAYRFFEKFWGKGNATELAREKVLGPKLRNVTL